MDGWLGVRVTNWALFV